MRLVPQNTKASSPLKRYSRLPWSTLESEYHVVLKCIEMLRFVAYCSRETKKNNSLLTIQQFGSGFGDRHGIGRPHLFGDWGDLRHWGIHCGAPGEGEIRACLNCEDLTELIQLIPLYRYLTYYYYTLLYYYILLHLIASYCICIILISPAHTCRILQEAGWFLGQERCTLALHGRDPGKVEALVKRLQRYTPKVHGFAAQFSAVELNWPRVEDMKQAVRVGSQRLGLHEARFKRSWYSSWKFCIRTVGWSIIWI